MSSKHYPEIDANPDFAALEEAVLSNWERDGTFKKSVENRPPTKADGSSNAYVFYDGPPFANGLPHYGHLLTGFVKDAIARYHTMKGSRVERRFGWDCHGLPAEMGAEKELGITGRAAIQQYGIGKFNEYCRSSVMKYTHEWEYYVTRQGRWVDFVNDYKTMDVSYMESCIWAFKQLYEKELTYESMRVMPYSWAAETPVSNFETRIDNATREREDKAAYVKFKLKEVPAGAPDAENYYLIAWTTTPWTLPSNLALAVNKDMNYMAAVQNNECFIATSSALTALAPQLFKDADKGWNLGGGDVEFKGTQLLGLTYEPLFPYFADTPNAFRVLDGSEFVTDGDGTGIVHMAPGFGEVDQQCCAENGIETLVPVDEKGRFTSEIFDIPWRTPQIAKGDFDPPPAGDGSQTAASTLSAGGGGSQAVPLSATGDGSQTEPLAPPPAGGRSNPLSRIWEGVGSSANSTRLPQTMQRADELRKNPTQAEKKLWAILRGKKLGGKKFRRQHAIGPYIVDFVCVNANLIIELDGGQHADQVEHDTKRSEYLASQQYRVIRFWSNEVLENPDGVASVIEEALAHPPEIAKGDFGLRPAGGGVRGDNVLMLQLQGLVVVPDSRLTLEQFATQITDEDRAQHIVEKDVAKYGLANMRIVRWLKAQGKLVKDEPFRHNYPHCWRTDTPLIYRAMRSWYVNVQQIKAIMAANNQAIHWIPDHVKDGQMGKGIESAPDWSISRNRFWGTPIPIWKATSGKLHVCGSIAEIEKLSGQKVADLHRPMIDQVVLKIEGEKYTRIEDVFDCWFESGSMPYAQVHYPFENKDWFEENFPADFITEYIAQTRGWFYTLQVLSAALFTGAPFLEKKRIDHCAPFQNVICHGVVIDEETGLKYSKRLKNYKDPKEVMDKFGADALRWMMLSSPVMRGSDLSVDPEGKFIRDVVRLNIKPLWSAFNFFTLYANADGVEAKLRATSENMLDRYILAKAKAAVTQVRASMDAYDTPGATEAITGFFEVLNNWYIRRSRSRFWNEEMTDDKQAAYDTLFTVLNLMCRAAAPLLPFVTEAVYRGLNGEASSVHLQDFPDVNEIADEAELIADMDWVREVCNAGSAVRNKQNIRNRQPLASLAIYGANPMYSRAFKSGDMGRFNREWGAFKAIIENELNMKEAQLFTLPEDFEKVASRKLVINSQILGKRLPEKMKQILPASKKGEWKYTSDVDPADNRGIVIANEVLEANSGEYTIILEAKPEFKESAQAAGNNVIVLDLTITPDLEAEGRARDLVRMVQQARKDGGLHVADRIALALDVPEDFRHALAAHGDYIAAQTLAVSWSEGAGKAAQQLKQELDGQHFTIGFTKVA